MFSYFEILSCLLSKLDKKCCDYYASQSALDNTADRKFWCISEKCAPDDNSGAVCTCLAGITEFIGGLMNRDKIFVPCFSFDYSKHKPAHYLKTVFAFFQRGQMYDKFYWVGQVFTSEYFRTSVQVDTWNFTWSENMFLVRISHNLSQLVRFSQN